MLISIVNTLDFISPLSPKPLKSCEHDWGRFGVSDDDNTEMMIRAFAEDLYAILENFIDETQDAKIVITKIETEISQLKTDLGYLNKVIRDGNGQDPLMTRLALLEERVKEPKEEMDKMEELDAETRRFRWEFFIAAIPGILALLTEMGGF